MKREGIGARCILAGVAAMALMSTGCSSLSLSGGGKVSLISMNMAAIDPPPAEVWEFNASECYWFVDEAGDLNIGLRGTKYDIMGASQLNLSFALDKPPAGSGRNYSVRQREARVTISHPATTYRFSPISGIVGVITKGDGMARGSFRMSLMSMGEVAMFSFLPQTPGAVLCFGTFEAREDAARGREIRLASEAGFGRPPRSAMPPAPSPDMPPQMARPTSPRPTVARPMPAEEEAMTPVRTLSGEGRARPAEKPSGASGGLMEEE